MYKHELIIQDTPYIKLSDRGINMIPKYHTLYHTLYNPLIKVNLDNTIKRINIWDYTHHASTTVNNIFNEIELKMPDIRTRTNYLIGGGNVLVDDIINNHINTNNKSTRIDTLIFDDINLSIFANVLGYYMQIGE